MKRKPKTTLAEKISAHVEGDTEFERFTDLFRQVIPPERPPEPEERTPPREKGKSKKPSGGHT